MDKKRGVLALIATTALIVLAIPASQVTVLAQTAGCGLQGAVFCDTFDAPAGIGNRSGDLNGNIWGVSRASGNVNFGQGSANPWFPTDVDACGTIIPAQVPPKDIVICNGQLHDAVNDGHNVTTLAMYPKQPFDFAGRTGKVVFDVSNDSLNAHDAWPEFWMSDKPVPTPFNHFDSWQSLPQNGFGVRMANGVPPGGQGLCPNGNNLDKQRWTVDSAVVVRNWVFDDTNGFGQRQVQLKLLDCVIAPNGPNGGLNHVEMDISQNQIDVYATDAGTTAPLHHIAQITNANLTLSRGLIWLEDAHYNAAKATGHEPEDGPHKIHTFAWDNVAFDGPFTFHDLSFDAPDTLTGPNGDGSVSLGRFALPGQATTWNVANMPANPTAAAVRVLFNFWDETNPTELDVSVNGHPHVLNWPYPDTLSFTWRTIDVQVPITDLVAGNNTVSIGSAQAMVVSNVNIVLSDVGGTPSTPVPTATTVPTSTAVPTDTPTVVPTDTSVPTQIPTDTPVATTQPTSAPTTEVTPTAVASYVPFPDCEVNVRFHATDGAGNTLPGWVESGWHACFLLQSVDPNATPTPTV
jgi:hypothetical protein